MNYVPHTDPSSSGSTVSNKEAENNKAIKEIQDKLNELCLLC